MKKILIIEDDEAVANVYRNKLATEGFQVEIALDGGEGFEKVGRFRPDAVIVDLMLPRVTGVELLKQIRAEPGFRQLPVIVFSNDYLSGMVQEAWNAGATHCLSKTHCTPGRVLDVVRSSLGLNGTPPPTAPPARRAAGSGVTPLARPSAVVEPPAVDADATFQRELRESFVGTLPAARTALRASLQTIFKAENETVRQRHVHDLHHRVHALTCNAAITGLLQIAQMAEALEALLKELYDKPKNINGSTLRTLTSGIDFLISLFDRTSAPETERPEATVLVVDDEAISRRAITYALGKAKLRSVNLEDPLQALELLPQQKFDLIFLDVDMPIMNGFELCSRVRTLPGYRNTPVVFITSLNDFESRANSTASGGNDFIAKPFLFIELAVKALVHVLRAQVQPARS